MQTERQNHAAYGTTGGWVLVVDDHPLFCDALELTLRAIGGFSDVRTCARLNGAIDMLQGGEKPAMVVLDLNLPDVIGLDGVVRMKTAAPDVPLLVVSSMADNSVISSTIRAGAAGFVPKHSPRATFQTAIDAIRAGASYVPQNFVDTGGNPTQADAVSRLASLTVQQGRILELICDGKLNKQIAYDLSIAETTVKAHVTAIMRKLGVQSRTQAVLVAQEARFSANLPESHHPT